MAFETGLPTVNSIKKLEEKKGANNSQLSIMFYFLFYSFFLFLVQHICKFSTVKPDGVNVQKQKSNKSIKLFIVTLEDMPLNLINKWWNRTGEREAKLIQTVYH